MKRHNSQMEREEDELMKSLQGLDLKNKDLTKKENISLLADVVSIIFKSDDVDFVSDARKLIEEKTNVPFTDVLITTTESWTTTLFPNLTTVGPLLNAAKTGNLVAVLPLLTKFYKDLTNHVTKYEPIEKGGFAEKYLEWLQDFDYAPGNELNYFVGVIRWSSQIETPSERHQMATCHSTMNSDVNRYWLQQLNQFVLGSVKRTNPEHRWLIESVQSFTSAKPLKSIQPISDFGPLEENDEN